MTPEMYHQWRKQIPFTDEEIAFALEDLKTPNEYMKARYASLAVLARAGRIFAATLRLVVPVLVTRCHICGARALYRYGCEGRCRVHRDMQPEWLSTHRAAREQRASACEDMRKTESQMAQVRNRLKRLEKYRTGRGRH